MSYARRFPVVLNLLVIAVTVVFVALALVVGRAESVEAPVVLEGDEAEIDYIAPRFISIEDTTATENARIRAAANVETVYTIDSLATNSAKNTVRAFYQRIREVAFLELFELPAEPPHPVEPLDPIGPLEPITPPTIDAPVATTPTTTAPTTEAPAPTTTVSQPEVTDEAAAGAAETTIPEETTTTVPATTQPPPTTTTTTTLPRRPLGAQIDLVEQDFSLYDTAINYFVNFHNRDLDAVADGDQATFDSVETQVLDFIEAELASGIREEDLTERQNRMRSDPPAVFVPGLTAEQQDELDEAAALVVALALRVNESPDFTETEARRQQARDGVDPVFVEFVASEPIVREGETISAVQLQALREADLLQVEAAHSRLAVATLGGIAVLLAAFFLWRIAPSEWSQPKHFALLGILLVLAALSARLPEVIVAENPQLAYTLPAVMFGYIAAILYEPRTAVLLAVPMATFTAVSTGDPALTVYAGAATVAPVAFVSSVSSRRQLRVAVALSAAVLAPLAGIIAWWFTGADTVVEAALFASLGGVLAGLVAQGLLSFLENLFRVTTTITLLDLTDRNHPALRLIEEQAPGTFNHSILVGTLAGKAARAIGADPLLAQAAAFYHDLGKTQNPQYFIENQFGVSNPHDELPAEESAGIIRNHVTDGLRLARQYRIPDEVAAGIRTHHGTGLMRYFYHKALDEDPGVDPDLFRHAGEKPGRREMAILMISDACEGAARALAQQEDPTADSIKKLVASVVGEKLEDGQLDESDLTYGDLTRVKHAIVEALIGYYHTRIPYPGFPGPRVEE
jgi:putative nucleotidyltransferase with HDIG domain